MKKIIPFILLALFAFTSKGFSQFDQPTFQLGVGLAIPLDQLKGDGYLMTYPYNGTPITIVDSIDFLTNNMGAKTGFSISGKAKINFDKYNVFRGVGFLSYTGFNAFQSTQSGNYPYRAGGNTYYPSANYNYSLSTFSFGLGLEVAPTAFTGVVSPFAGANLSFNSFNGTIDRAETSSDTSRYKFSGFRIGVNFDAGIEFKVNPQLGFAIGFKYDLGNLLLRQKASGSISDRVDWGRTNGVFYDDGTGTYLGNIQKSPYNPNDGGIFTANQKNLNWGTVYIAVNFFPNAFNKPGSTKKK